MAIENKNIRVRGCIHGLDQKDPELPKNICRIECVWRVNAPEDFNCAWKVFSKQKAHTLREIGIITGTTHESIRNIEKNAIQKILSVCKEESDFYDVKASKKTSERTIGNHCSDNAGVEAGVDFLLEKKGK